MALVKNPPADAGDLRDMSSIPGPGDPLEEGMVTHASILALRIPWIEEPGGLQSIRPHTIGHEQSHLAHTYMGYRGTAHLLSLMIMQASNVCAWSQCSVQLFVNPRIGAHQAPLSIRTL